MTELISEDLNTPQALSAKPEQPGNPPPRKRWFVEGELVCRNPGCGKPMPAGYYSTAKVKYECDLSCRYRYILSRRKPVRCTFCKRPFVKKGTQHTSPFCCPDHYYQWRKKQHDVTRAGRFARLLNEYIDEIAPKRYAPTSINTMRCNLLALFEFLNKSNIRSLNSVGPQIISRFLSSLAGRRPKSVGRFASHLRCLFDWLILSGRRTKANPVILSLHSSKPVRRLPRPFNSSELAMIWKVLDKQTNPALRLAVALGQEAGLRISEVANLRVAEIDPVCQQVFVRLPNKVQRERVVPFHEKTKKYLSEWLAVRGNRGHDRLLAGPSGKPMASFTLRRMLDELLKPVISDWCFHRLRHVASTTMFNAGADGTMVMRTFGWQSAAVWQGYTEVSKSDLRESYDRAFQIQEGKLPGSTVTRSLDEFFAKTDEPTMKA